MKFQEIIAKAHRKAVIERSRKRLDKLLAGKDIQQPTTIHRLSDFLKKHYELRYNQISTNTEYRKHNSKEFHPLTLRDMNTICLSAHDAGILCWDRDVYRYIQSSRIKSYHPFKAYIDTLPQWDGTERVEALAKRISDSPIWTMGFHRWMLAMMAQWMELNKSYANSLMPILVSERQGMGKSTFCRSLLPPPLQEYYTDNVNMTNLSQLGKHLTEMGLINLDEFDQISAQKHPMLKNIMQLTGLRLRKAYQHDERNLTRIASFIGTSNSHELLTDPSGSRRFICVDVTHPIENAPIQHDQLYAQLKEELQGGNIYWFTKEEEEAIQRNNQPFYKSDSLQEILSQHFRIPQDDEETTLYSLQEIIALTRRKSDIPLTGIRVQDFSKALRASGIERIHTSMGNRYRVVEVHKS